MFSRLGVEANQCWPFDRLRDRIEVEAIQSDDIWWRSETKSEDEAPKQKGIAILNHGRTSRASLLATFDFLHEGNARVITSF